jgi:hypothetical protein
MHARVLSGAVLGIDAYLVQVEADVANGLPNFTTVGLPQGAVREGEKRVVAAIQNSGYQIPPRRITINLAPADGTEARLQNRRLQESDRMGFLLADHRAYRWLSASDLVRRSSARSRSRRQRRSNGDHRDCGCGGSPRGIRHEPRRLERAITIVEERCERSLLEWRRILGSKNGNR